MQHLTPLTETMQGSFSCELRCNSTTLLSKPWYSALTQKLWQNVSCVELGGMNNRLHAVMTIFTIEYFLSKISGTRVPFTPTGQQPGNSY